MNYYVEKLKALSKTCLCEARNTKVTGGDPGEAVLMRMDDTWKITAPSSLCCC